MVFNGGFPPFSFTVYSNWIVEMRKSFREFEEIEILRQRWRGDCEGSKEENIGVTLLAAQVAKPGTTKSDVVLLCT